MLIFSPHITPRLRYIATELLHRRWGLTCTFTSDEQEFTHHTGPRINYSHADIGGFQLLPYGLLEETGHRESDVARTRWESEQVLFPVSGGHLPFDLFSMAFYLLSRYEEYHSLYTDEHGRFMATESIAFKTGNLHRPWLDNVLQRWERELRVCFPELNIRPPAYQFIPTFDIDMVRTFEGKPLWRSISGGLRELMSGQRTRLTKRLQVLLGNAIDPGDVLEYICSQTEGLNPVIFWLLADYSDMDKNLYWQHPLMKQTVKHCEAFAQAGIHPSYYSSVKNDITTEEINRLKTLTGHEVTKSRQHFLRFTLPDTFEQLAAAGIEKEYSMGYASHTGFRASTCFPFRFYNVVTDEAAPLELVPFAVMDVTLKHYLELSPEAANAHISALVNEVRAVQGTFVSLWHNESLSEFDEWAGWRNVFEHLIATARA